jgi:hypothetical protein
MRQVRFSATEEEILIELEEVKRPFVIHVMTSPFVGESEGDDQLCLDVNGATRIAPNGGDDLINSMWFGKDRGRLREVKRL